MKKLLNSGTGLIILIVVFVFGIAAVAYSFDRSADEISMDKSEMTIEKGVQADMTMKCGDEADKKCDAADGDDEKKCGEADDDDEKKCGEADDDDEKKCGEADDEKKCGEGKCGDGDDDSGDDTEDE